jgi:hypothetical protein
VTAVSSRDLDIVFRVRSGQSVTSVAADMDMSEDDVLAVLRDPGVRQSLARYRRASMSLALQKLVDAAPDFVDVLHEIATSPDERASDRIRAAGNGLTALSGPFGQLAVQGELDELAGDLLDEDSEAARAVEGDWS